MALRFEQSQNLYACDFSRASAAPSIQLQTTKVVQKLIAVFHNCMKAKFNTF